MLLVEDDADIAAALALVLENEGFRAIVAGDVATATAEALRSSPAVIVLDWNLPDGTGEDVVRAIRPDLPSVPILVISAAHGSLRDSLRVDASERLVKPFDVARIVELVRRYAQ